MKKRKRHPGNPMPALFMSLALTIFPSSSASSEKENSSLMSSLPLKLSGFAQLRFAGMKNGSNSFLIKRSRASLSGHLLKNILFKLQVEMVKSPVLLDAQVDIEFPHSLTLRMGQFKVPFSQENLIPSSALDSINRSQTVEKLCPGRDIGANGRDIGIALSGKFARMDLTLGIFNGSGINKEDADSRKDLAGRLAFHPVSILSIAGQFYRGKQSASSSASLVSRDRFGLEAAFSHHSLSVKGEFLSSKDDRLKRAGWYLQAGYFLSGKKIQFIIKNDSYDPNRSLSGNRNILLTLGVNWFLAERTKFQVNTEFSKKEAGRLSYSAVLAQFQAGF